jgi:hypothetical protein
MSTQSCVDKSPYLMPVDADPDRIGCQVIRYQHFYKNLAKLNARSVFVILDACFSGGNQVMAQ